MQYAGGVPSNSGPAIMQPTEEPPAYTKSGQQVVQQPPKSTINTEELQVVKVETTTKIKYILIMIFSGDKKS